MEDCGGPGTQEGKAAAVSKDGCGQLTHEAGLAAPGQAGLTALQIQTTFGATEKESARGAQAGEVAVVLPSHTIRELADQYKLKWHGPTPFEKALGSGTHGRVTLIRRVCDGALAARKHPRKSQDQESARRELPRAANPHDSVAQPRGDGLGGQGRSIARRLYRF